MPKKYNKQESKRRILSVCVKLFIEKGYHKTTLAEILSRSDTTSSTFQNIFRSKDGVLLDLTEFMFENQFSSARSIAGEEFPPIFLYAAETAVQLALTATFMSKPIPTNALRNIFSKRPRPNCTEFFRRITPRLTKAISTSWRSARRVSCEITWQDAATSISPLKKRWSDFSI